MLSKIIQVMDEGSCPFLGGEYYSCCVTGLVPFR